MDLIGIAKQRVCVKRIFYLNHVRVISCDLIGCATRRSVVVAVVVVFVMPSTMLDMLVDELKIVKRI